MKTSIILFLLLPFMTFGQFVNGDAYIEGSLSVHHSGQNGRYKTIQIAVDPSIGFLIAPDIAVGALIGYDRYRYDNSPNIGYERRSDSYSAGAFIKKFFSVADNLLISIEGTARYSRIHDRQFDFNLLESKTKYYGISAGLTPSLIFFPSSRFGFEGRFGSIYFSHNENLSTDDSSNTFDLQLGQFSIGLLYFFDRE
jgi:hypothetical protein